ncbi:MAG: thioesterase family protein [Burkholderiaceae bacterium]
MTESSRPHPFDQALVLDSRGADSLSIKTDETYWNMAGPFGGWLLALGVKGILTHPAARGTPVEAHARFFAAPRAGEMAVRVELLSQGRSVGHWRAGLWQTQEKGPRLCAEISMILGDERPTLDVQGTSMPEVPPPEALARQDTSLARVRWLRRFDFRYVRGIPFQPGTPQEPAEIESVLWISHAQPRRLDWVGLAAFADVPAPRPFLLTQQPGPVATVSLSLYFHANAAELEASGPWLLLRINGHAMRRGFFDHRVELWRSDGRLLATSTQLAWFA